MIIDSHCHLLSMEYENVDEQIKMAIENGVTKMIINGYDLKSSMEAVSLANKYKEVYARKAVPGEIIKTYTKDGLETQNIAKEGDFVVRNITEAEDVQRHRTLPDWWMPTRANSFMRSILWVRNLMP